MRRLFAKAPPRHPDPLQGLRDASLAPQPLGGGEVVEDIWFHIDPKAELRGTWSSPRGRMLELETKLATPGDWCALHLRLDLDVAACAYVGLVARTVAAQSLVTRACLRSGIEDGFHDQFFARQILSQPGQSDHIDMLAPAQCPDMPACALWHEFILFLPPNRSISWALHDLRLIVL
jgi:hypothetical protein